MGWQGIGGVSFGRDAIADELHPGREIGRVGECVSAFNPELVGNERSVLSANAKGND
jgi:hypothetical protein